MAESLSENTKAILMLTAPLMLGKRGAKAELLKPSEYQRFARHLLDIGRQPADLLSVDADAIIGASAALLPETRLRGLLDRGFLLSQAVERWQSRAIWVVSRADTAYPRCLKVKMKTRAPAVLYGCGDIGLLNTGGLAVVGSRHVDDALMAYAGEVGALAARAHQTVISGGAKGVDRAAMDGALGAGGRVIGVLAEELEREAMNRMNRDALRSGKLALVTEYDPCSRFSVGHAMQRNKLIYAFCDHALVVNAELEKGGTWAGAAEQLDKLQFAPVFVRSTGEPNRALEALRERGAFAWPDPQTPDSLQEMLRDAASGAERPSEQEGGTAAQKGNKANGAKPSGCPSGSPSPAEALFEKVRELVIPLLSEPKGDEHVAELLRVGQAQAREWLDRMVDAGVLVRTDGPTRYAVVGHAATDRGEHQ